MSAPARPARHGAGARDAVLLLDDPAMFLDIAHQLDLLDLVRRQNRDRRTTVMMVLHDLTQVSRYADHLIALRDGRGVAAGTAAAVITPALVRRAASG